MAFGFEFVRKVLGFARRSDGNGHSDVPASASPQECFDGLPNIEAIRHEIRNSTIAMKHEINQLEQADALVLRALSLRIRARQAWLGHIRRIEDSLR